MPAFAAARREVRCDLIRVDGGHQSDVPRLDMIQLLNMSSPRALVVMDDVGAPWNRRVCFYISFCGRMK